MAEVSRVLWTTSIDHSIHDKSASLTVNIELCNTRWCNNGSTFRFMESSGHRSWRIRGFTLHKQYTEYPETGTTLLSPTGCTSQLKFHRRDKFYVQQYVVLYDAIIIGAVIIIKSTGRGAERSRELCVFSKYLILLVSHYLVEFFCSCLFIL